MAATKTAVEKENVGEVIYLPMIPRRCDHMQIRLRGRGDVRVFSVSKVLEVGRMIHQGIPLMHLFPEKP